VTAPEGVAVRVVHGHLAFASYPVLVGHDPGDSLNGTELVLDRRQAGRISRRRNLGLHPGPVGPYDVTSVPRAVRARPGRRFIQDDGAMFWFMWKKFSGSYLAFSSRSR
jgi:hypothetical protein